MKKILYLCVMVLSISFWLPTQLFACSIPAGLPTNDKERAAKSDLVVRGTVISTEVESSVINSNNIRKTKFLVNKVYKGHVQGDTITINVETNKVGCPWPEFKDGEIISLGLQVDKSGIIHADLWPAIKDESVLAKLESKRGTTDETSPRNDATEKMTLKEKYYYYLLFPILNFIKTFTNQ